MSNDESNLYTSLVIREGRGKRYYDAVLAIEARGERPTARAVLRECGYAPRRRDNGYGKVIDQGMGGEELRIFAAAMIEAGYHRVPRGRYEWDLRWAKREGLA